jgi:hypothetical protein
MKISITTNYNVSVTREYDISPETLSEIDETLESLWENLFDDEPMPDPSNWTPKQIQEVAESYGEYEQIEEDWSDENVVEAILNE